MKTFLQSLNKLFDMSPNDPSDVEHPENGPTSEVEVPEGLFIEKEAPVINEPQKVQVNESKLVKFLNRDFRSMGYSDGYRYHSVEVMDNSKRLMGCEYREIIDVMIDESKGKLSQLQKHAVDMRYISRIMEEKVGARIVEIKETISDLEQEKELSAIGEGFVMKAIYQYRDGFIRGVEDFNEETLLMSGSGIFK